MVRETDGMEDVKIESILGDDIGYMELIDQMGSDLRVAQVARVSFNKLTLEYGEREQKLIKFLADNHHSSPFRHVQLSIRVKAPIFIARQAVKHQVGMSWNEVSARYTEVKEEFFIPALYRGQSKSNRQASEGFIDNEHRLPALVTYKNAVDYAFKAYQDLLEMGVAREMARGVLPVTQYTEWIWTMSLAAAAHFVLLRDDKHAQVEMQHYGKAMYAIVKAIAPDSIAALTGRK